MEVSSPYYVQSVVRIFDRLTGMVETHRHVSVNGAPARHLVEYQVYDKQARIHNSYNPKVDVYS